MSVIERALSAVKQVMLIEKAIGDLRGDVTGLSSDVAALARDMRDLEQRVARIEGAHEAFRALAVRQPRLPEE